MSLTKCYSKTWGFFYILYHAAEGNSGGWTAPLGKQQLNLLLKLDRKIPCWLAPRSISQVLNCSGMLQWSGPSTSENTEHRVQQHLLAFISHSPSLPWVLHLPWFTLDVSAASSPYVLWESWHNEQHRRNDPSGKPWQQWWKGSAGYSNFHKGLSQFFKTEIFKKAETSKKEEKKKKGSNF